MATDSLEKPKQRILFLAADPTNASQLHLSKELQEVRDRLSDNPNFDLKDQLAVKPDDVIKAIAEYKPNIVHFLGHGEETGELCFEDELGKAKSIPPDALAQLFEQVREFVKCVVVNTCYSEKQAKAIAQFVPVVIGTKKMISDQAAIKFSTGFYTALDPDLSPQSLETAFKRGKISITFDGNLSEQSTPIIIFGSPEIRFASLVDTALLSITIPDGKVFQTLIKGLSLTGEKMGLGVGVVKNILDNKIQNIRKHDQNIVEYENNLREILRDEYPLSEISKSALLQLQNGLGLTNEIAKAITDKVLEDPKLNNDYSWYDRGLGQFGLKNYEKAIEYLTTAIEKNLEYSAAYYQRGECYLNLQMYDLAITDLSKSIDCNANWDVGVGLSNAYFLRGFTYYDIQPRKKGNVTLALQDWTKTLDINPNDGTTLYNRGLAHHFLRNFEKAVVDFKKSLEIDISLPNTKKASTASQIVKCYQELGNQEEVDKWAKKGIDYL
jgi:tetratricopeptide (TPR) repeat protein